MTSPSASTSSGVATVRADRRWRAGSLHTILALAFAPLCLVVGAGLWLVFLDASAVRADLQRMFEELREVALTRSLLDDLRGLEQWVEAVPEARRTSHELVFADLHHHLRGASDTLARFHVADDPSDVEHTAEEQPLQNRIERSLRTIDTALDGDHAIGELAEPLRLAVHSATVLAHAVEEESRAIGDVLDRRSEQLSRFMLLLGLASLATIGGLGWLLHRRVMLPVRDLRAGTLALGRGERVALRPRHDDELGDLATTFTTMATQLTESRRDLEQRVVQRTRELLRTARLAQLGTLAAGIAHEINNPLASIAACAQGLLRDPGAAGGDARVREYLQILQKEALRARDITSRLLRFAHQGETRRGVVWLGTEVHEVAPMFHHQLADAGVQLSLDAPNRGPAILGDAAEWRQVLFNLLRNALDASPKGSRIRVTALERDGRVVLEVADQGPGIAEDHRERLFEPFFTTKPPGKGTGLGLAIVHRIVHAHDGTIGVDAAPEGGALFRIELPAAPPDAQ
ncbi:MAG: HAMP domain-containing histidine kinase [Planctomycetes bacterium]|nr:HAMP domain-containing histidine kinase [Planctomycetota bacterium]